MISLIMAVSPRLE